QVVVADGEQAAGGDLGAGAGRAQRDAAAPQVAEGVDVAGGAHDQVDVVVVESGQRDELAGRVAGAVRRDVGLGEAHLGRAGQHQVVVLGRGGGDHHRRLDVGQAAADQLGDRRAVGVVDGGRASGGD